MYIVNCFDRTCVYSEAYRNNFTTIRAAQNILLCPTSRSSSLGRSISSPFLLLSSFLAHVYWLSTPPICSFHLLLSIVIVGKGTHEVVGSDNIYRNVRERNCGFSQQISTMSWFYSKLFGQVPIWYILVRRGKWYSCQHI